MTVGASLGVRIGSFTRRARAPASSQVNNRQFHEQITFTYRVTAGDYSTNGVSVVANSLRLDPGATLRDASGGDVSLTHGSFSARNSNYNVNTSGLSTSIS